MKIRRSGGIVAVTAMAAIALLASLAALTFAACDSSDARSDTIANTAGSASFQAANSLSEGIAVSGQGIVTAAPDTAHISLGVSLRADTARSARDQGAQAMGKLIASVRDNGIDEKDIKTTQLSLQPKYDYSAGRQRLIGYRVHNSVSVKIKDLNRAAEIMDEAVEAVGDPVQVGGISFTLEDQKTALAQAREQAMADALAKAQQLARLGDVELGRPINISESVSGLQPPVIYRGDLRAGAAEAPTPVQPGEVQTSVTVNVTYGIR